MQHSKSTTHTHDMKDDMLFPVHFFSSDSSDVT